MSYYDYNMANIARALGVTRQHVYSWKRKDRIPFLQQCQLQVITNGDLVARKEDDKE
jgi:hypothetical protein